MIHKRYEGLCVGGPLHGQHYVSEMPSFRMAEWPEPKEDYFEHKTKLEGKIHTYYEAHFELNGRRVYFWRHMDLGVSDLRSRNRKQATGESND